jgi:hypothetical protein
MKKTLMITVSVAALVAAGGMAFAQGVNAPRDPAATAAPVQKNDKSDKSDKMDKMKVETPNKAEAVKPAPNAQLPAKNGVKPETSGQGSTMQPVQRDGTPSNDRVAPKAQTEAPKAQTDAPKGPAQADAKQAAPAPLSAEHHAKIWQAVRGEKAAPFTGAKFSITVGEAVPQTVHLNRLPVSIIEFAPQYRGYEYVLVGDEIIIIDPRTHRIVAVIPA